jgi:hypothetical protein
MLELSNSFQAMLRLSASSCITRHLEDDCRSAYQYMSGLQNISGSYVPQPKLVGEKPSICRTRSWGMAKMSPRFRGMVASI